MGGGNTKPGSAEMDDEADDGEFEENQPQGGRRDLDNDYARNQQEREELNQQTRKPTMQQRASNPPPQRTPVRAQQQDQYQDDDEEEEEDMQYQQPAPNNRSYPTQQQQQQPQRTPVNNRQQGNYPGNNNRNQMAGNQSQVTPKAMQGQSTQLRGNGAPNVPKGRPGASNTGNVNAGNMQGKAPIKGTTKVGGAPQGDGGRMLAVEQQKLVRKQDPNTVFTQFVKGIKSEIPYPVSMQALRENRAFDTYFFTSNTNIFHGLDEEKLIVVPLSELTKVYDALDAAEQGDCLDETFAPVIESLAEIPSRQAPFKAIIWKKISEHYPKREIPIIQKTNNPESIDPGDLRDLAFQSVVAIVSENEAVIPSNFPDINEISHKVYSVWLNDGGEWECFIVDENFPFDKGVNDWAFTKTKDPTDPTNFESWVLIMEKAFAKMYGCYERLERGHPAHFLHDITGAPYDHFFFDDEVKCWEFLDAINRDLTVVVAMSKHPSVMIENENIVDKTPAYCYKVQGQVEIMTQQGKEKLIQMRSPWGFANWQGDWAKSSPRWTPELMNELNPTGYKDDTYWISIADFVKSFGVGFIYTLFNDYLQCSLRLEQSMQKNYTLLLINVPGKGGHGFIKVSQKDARHFETMEGGDGYEYSVVKMMLVKVDAKMKLKTFVGGIFDKGRDCELEVILEAGDYLAYIEVDWMQDECTEIVFNSYHEVNLVMYELESKEDQGTVLRRFLKCYFLTASQSRTVEKYPKAENGQIEKLSEYVYGYLCFYYLNLSKLYAIEEVVRMNSLYGLEICPPYRNNFEFDISVPHGKDDLVIYRTSTQTDSAYHYRHTVWSVVYPDCDDQSLKNLVIEKATGYKRRSSTKGGDIDVIIFTYEFEGGFVWYYLNKTPYIYEELLLFDTLTNMIDFQNDFKQEHNLFIKPGEGAFVKYRVDDPTMPYNYSTRLKFRLVDPMSMKMQGQIPMDPQQGGEGEGQQQPKKGAARSGPGGAKKPVKANMPGRPAGQGGGQGYGQGGGQEGYY